MAEARVEKTQPNVFSADETADVGIDNQTPVAQGIGIGPDTRFTGRICKISLEESRSKILVRTTLVASGLALPLAAPPRLN